MPVAYFETSSAASLILVRIETGLDEGPDTVANIAPINTRMTDSWIKGVISG